MCLQGSTAVTHFSGECLGDIDTYLRFSIRKWPGYPVTVAMTVGPAIDVGWTIDVLWSAVTPLGKERCLSGISTAAQCGHVCHHVMYLMTCTGRT